MGHNCSLYHHYCKSCQRMTRKIKYKRGLKKCPVYRKCHALCQSSKLAGDSMTEASKKSLKVQRYNQNPYIDEQTTQWSKEKEQTTIYKTYT